jgi:hypothetical protein
MSTYSDGVLICNVGKFRDNPANSFGILYLARATFEGLRQEFFVTLRPAITTPITTAKEWVFTAKSLVEAQKAAGNAVVAPGILEMVDDFFPANDVMSNSYAGLKPDVLTNADVIYAATPPSTIPAAGTIKGENITATMVESILDLGLDGSPYGLGLLPGETPPPTVKLTANFKADPTKAITATITNPAQAFKDYPMQSALIILGVLEVGSRMFAGKPFIIPIGSKKKPLLG